MEAKAMIWKDVPGYEGSYRINNSGIVISSDRYVANKRGIMHLRKGRIMKPYTSKQNGYQYMMLSKDSKPINHRVHRLVAITFLPNPNNLPQINHINCIKTDNRVENLEWCDAQMNTKHAYDNGLIDIKKALNSQEKNKPINVFSFETGDLIGSYKSRMEASITLNVSISRIRLHLIGKIKQTKGYVFKDANINVL